jgi:hypothetical protein
MTAWQKDSQKKKTKNETKQNKIKKQERINKYKTK